MARHHTLALFLYPCILIFLKKNSLSTNHRFKLTDYKGKSDTNAIRTR